MTVSTDVIQEIAEIVGRGAGRPVLFIGSGFSRRYLGLEDWRALLERFSQELPRPFEYYFARAERDLPRTAELLAEAFNELWWNGDRYRDSREKSKGVVGAVADPLKIEISLYLGSIGTPELAAPLSEELELFKKTAATAIVTTNWDCFLEQLFPTYQVFVGQGEAISRRIHGVGEIYKIHGSCAQPLSLVMTSTDYRDYNERNPYLAAKLLALFLEHPVFFIGYSVGDPNIKQILSRVAYCLDDDTRAKVGRRIAIVRWSPAEEAHVRTREIELDLGVRLAVSEIVVPDFVGLFSIIGEAENSIDASLLRKIKDYLYDIVLSADPKERISVISPDDLDGRDDIDFVVGVGIQAKLAGQGVVGLQRMDLLRDIAANAREYDTLARELVLEGIPAMQRGGAKTIPVARYLRVGGFIEADGSLAGTVPAVVRKLYELDRAAFEDSAYRYRKADFQDKSLSEILAEHPRERAVVFMTLMDIPEAELGKFICENADLLSSKTQQAQDCFAKLICIWDRKTSGVW
jgi:hypothetical protein